jgi:hypothetical protein
MIGLDRVAPPMLPLLLLLALLAHAPTPLIAQTFEGRVLDAQDDTPVGTALVRLVDDGGEQHAVTAADSTGAYRIEAPEPGVYRLQAERLGYYGMQTPLLEAGNTDAVYPLDLLMRRAPLPIQGLEVSRAGIDRRLRLMIGMSPASLRKEPIGYEEIRGHIERGHDLSDLLRWSNTASLLVFRTDDGPCYTLRGGPCLPVYFNGARFGPEVLDVVPLDMIHTILILYPKENIAYERGAILLYSGAWLR